MARRLRRLSPPRSEAGFTLIEMLVSALLVTIIGAAVAMSQIKTTKSAADQRHRSQANELAQQDQERLAGLSDQQLNALNSLTPRAVTISGTAFTVTSSATYLNSAFASSCSSSTAATAYYRILSDVTWLGNMRVDVRQESMIARPIGGNMLVQVNDQTGGGLPGATVATSGPTVQSGVTDSLGCMTFSGLAAGTYTVTATDSGYVDPTGSSAPSTSLSLTAGSIATPPAFTLGRAGLINADFWTQATPDPISCPPANGQCTLQTADSISWLGTGNPLAMSAPGSSVPLAAPAPLVPASGTISLFPFAFVGSGNSISYDQRYQVWAGKCAQMQPPTTPTAYDKFTVGPGSPPQTVHVQEPALAVLVTYGGARVKPNDVKISFTNVGGVSCGDSWSPQVASNAATNVNGSLAYPGQPYATNAAPLSVCADYNGSGTWKSNSPTLSLVKTPNTNFSGVTQVTVPLTSSSSATKC